MKALNRKKAPIIKDAVEFDLKLKQCDRYTLNNGVEVYAIDAGAEDVLLVDCVFYAGNWFEQKNLVAASTNFLLKNGNLYPDDMTGPIKKHRFKNGPLPEEKALLANDLKEQIPEFLRNSGSDRFGCPDCLDQGAYYIELRENGKIQKFHLDTDTSAVPRELRLFLSTLGTTLRQF